MKYDFTTLPDRRGRDALAVDRLGAPGAPGAPEAGFDAIPMWIADMNFLAAPSIIQAMQERIAHPVFGYFDLSAEYYAAIQNWQSNRNNVTDLPREAIGYENGVLGCVASALQAFTAPGETVLLHSPTYVGFTGTIENAGRKILHSPLVRDEQGVWRMDYEDMDRKLRENHIHFAVFCSPHNPTGRVWTRDEIGQAMEIYRKNDCVVISDEIWSDLVLDGHKHIPTQSVSEDARSRTIAIYAPSKTFNLAGLIGSYHIVYDSMLRDRLRRQASLCHYNSCNVLSMHALIGAYQPEGAEWLDELRGVLTQNVADACSFIEREFTGVTLARPEGTYMLYPDCSGWCKAHGKTMDELLQAGYAVGVAWQDGRPFQMDYTIRLNLASPHARVMEALERLKKYVFTK